MRASTAGLPLVSLMLLTCNRPAFLRLSLQAAAAQTYPNLEVVVVDDGPRPVDIRQLGAIAVPGKLSINFVRMAHRSTIGAKRNAALQASRGEVVVHWDDDDLHGSDQVRSLVCPIVRNETELTAPYFEYIASLGKSGLQFFDFRRPEVKSQCFLGALAYRRAVAESLTIKVAGGGRPTSPAPFANTSLSEDLHFVERALNACHRMLPVAAVPLAYTRHRGVSNTWRSGVFEHRMEAGAISSLPSFVDRSLPPAFIAAEVDVVHGGACAPLARTPPRGIQYPLLYPNNPKRCCRGQKLTRPCDPRTGACDPDDTFCGASKGICTASCTCAGEKSHGRKVRMPDGDEKVPLACGLLCCRYWHEYWKAHPEECSSHSVRPLKRHYCGSVSPSTQSRTVPARNRRETTNKSLINSDRASQDRSARHYKPRSVL